jgi:hypothetical protein
MGQTLTGRLAGQNAGSARAILVVVATAVVGIVAGGLQAAGVASGEVLATALFLPVFAAALFGGRTAGLVTAFAATALYVALRRFDLEAAGTANAAVLVVTRGIAYAVAAHIGALTRGATSYLGEAPAAARSRPRDRGPAPGGRTYRRAGDFDGGGLQMSTTSAWPDPQDTPEEPGGWPQGRETRPAEDDSWAAVQQSWRRQHGVPADDPEPSRRPRREPDGWPYEAPGGGDAWAGHPTGQHWGPAPRPDEDWGADPAADPWRAPAGASANGNGQGHGQDWPPPPPPPPPPVRPGTPGEPTDMWGQPLTTVSPHVAREEPPAPPAEHWGDPRHASPGWDQPGAPAPAAWADPQPAAGGWGPPAAGPEPAAWGEPAPAADQWGHAGPSDPGAGAWPDAAPAAPGGWNEPPATGDAWSPQGPADPGAWGDPAPAAPGAWPDPGPAAPAGWGDPAAPAPDPGAWPGESGWPDPGTGATPEQGSWPGQSGWPDAGPPAEPAPGAWPDPGRAGDAWPAEPAAAAGWAGAPAPPAPGPAGGWPDAGAGGGAGGWAPPASDAGWGPPPSDSWSSAPPEPGPPPDAGPPPPLPAVDPETGLWTAKFLRDRLSAERSRSRRSHRPFSLVLVQVPDGPLAALPYRRQLTLLRELGYQFVAGGVVDHLVHVPDREQHWFAVILPDTDRSGAQVLERRLRLGIGGYLSSRGMRLADLQSASLTAPDDDPQMGEIWEALIGPDDAGDSSPMAVEY